jgi:hypothetical protein
MYKNLLYGNGEQYATISAELGRRFLYWHIPGSSATEMGIGSTKICSNWEKIPISAFPPGEGFRGLVSFQMYKKL